MTWCENNGIDYIFGLSGTKPLARKVDEVADDRSFSKEAILNILPKIGDRFFAFVTPQ